jgi:two-component system cell cycle response regulator DivK
MPDEPCFVYFEDDVLSGRVFELLMISLLGYSQLAVFNNTEHLFDKLDGLPWKADVIFLDIHILPHDGFTVIDMLRSRADYAHVIIVALTASVMNEEINALKMAGFNGAISKPIDQNMFPDLLEQILNGVPVWHVM